MKILNKPNKGKSDEDLAELVPIIKTIQFFKDRDIKDADYPEIISSMNYEFCPAGHDVFEYGSYGEKFYIILQGEVKVIIPNPEIWDFKERFEEHKQKLKQEEQKTKLDDERIERLKKERRRKKKEAKRKKSRNAKYRAMLGDVGKVATADHGSTSKNRLGSQENKTRTGNHLRIESARSH